MSGHGLFSVRMRAASGARHLSGAERIAPFPLVSMVVQRFLERAWSKGVAPDQVVLTLEPIADSEIRQIRALDLVDVRLSSVAGCRDMAARILRTARVGPQALLEAFFHLDRGPSQDGGAMRGAMIMDAVTGERLEPDRSRGIRASRFDWSDDAFLHISEELSRLGLTHFRTREALALASKMAHAPGFVAELCWSDDPDYSAGYVASRTSGYVRLPALKDRGLSSGGRALFIDRNDCDLEALTAYLTREPVIIAAIGLCRTANDADAARIAP